MVLRPDVSLQRRREEIRDRFERIYEELGIVRKAQGEDDAAKPEGKRAAVDQRFRIWRASEFADEETTADIAEIRDAIDSIKLDPSGEEKIFHALFLGADKYKSYRTGSDSRNVVFIVVTERAW